MKCFIAFRLAPGVTYEQYLAWFQQRNARAVATMSTIRDFRVWRAVHVEDGDPGWEIIEEMEVSDRAAFERELEELPLMHETVGEWAQLAHAPSITYADEILPTP